MIIFYKNIYKINNNSNYKLYYIFNKLFIMSYLSNNYIILNYIIL